MSPNEMEQMIVGLFGLFMRYIACYLATLALGTDRYKSVVGKAQDLLHRAQAWLEERIKYRAVLTLAIQCVFVMTVVIFVLASITVVIWIFERVQNGFSLTLKYLQPHKRRSIRNAL